MTTDDHEHFHDTLEHAAHRRRFAVAEYASTPPHLRTGYIPEEKLIEWQEALHEPHSPEELLSSAWVDAELGFHYLFFGANVLATETGEEPLYTTCSGAQ